MAKTMLNLRRFNQNSHPVWAKMMAKLFRRGISVLYNYRIILFYSKTFCMSSGVKNPFIKELPEKEEVRRHILPVIKEIVVRQDDISIGVSYQLYFSYANSSTDV